MSRTQVDDHVSQFQVLANEQIVILGTDGNLWLASPPYGHPPPARVQIDGHAQRFHAADASTMYVLGSDGNLWLEQAPFGNPVPPTQTVQVDGSVANFQVLANGKVAVLGRDGALWLESPPFGLVPPSRTVVDGKVAKFQALDSSTDFCVLGTDQVLWRAHFPYGTENRLAIDGNVQDFLALQDSTDVWVLGTDGNLWLEHAPYGVANRGATPTATGVSRFALDGSRVATLKSGALYSQSPTKATLVDQNVQDFQVLAVDNGFHRYAVLGTDGKLWIERSSNIVDI